MSFALGCWITLWVSILAYGLRGIGPRTYHHHSEPHGGGATVNINHGLFDGLWRSIDAITTASKERRFFK